MGSTRIGVIGLGNMGLPMAQSLLRGGFDVIGFDLGEGRRALASAGGVDADTSLEKLLGRADAILLSLPRPSDVEHVLVGNDALLTRRDRRVLVIDTSTSDPGTSRRLAARLGEAGHGHLDAPVSGGPPGAAAGKLTMMVGGEAADVAAARPVLDAVGGVVLHVGPSGAGNVAKLVNNMLVAANMALVGEALRLGEAAGVGAEALLTVVNAATGRSVVSERHLPNYVLNGRFDSGFSAGLMRKDIGLAADLARETGVDLPISEAVVDLWRRTRAVSDADDFTRMTLWRPTRGD